MALGDLVKSTLGPKGMNKILQSGSTGEINVTNDGVDIYDGLSGYFDDIVDWEGGKARMEVSLVEAPPLLQIQLQVRRVCQLTLITSLIHYFNTEGPVQPRDSAAIQIAGVCQVR